VNPTTKKTLRWVAGTLIVLVALFVIYLLVERVRGRAALDEYLAKMRAKGEQFSIAELTPAPVPPELNGAGMLMGVNLPANGMAPGQLPAAMRFTAPGVAVPAAKVHAWSFSVQLNVLLATNFPGDPPVTNTAATNTNSRAARGRNVMRPTLRTILTTSNLAAEIALHSNALSQVHAALLSGPIDHNLEYSKGFTMPLPHLSREKALTHWLRAASLSALQQNNSEASLTNLQALAALAHAATNEPMMISQLVRAAIHQIAVSAVWEALQADGWNDQELRVLQGALEPSDFVSSMSRALEMERAMGLALIDRASEDFNVAVGLMDTDAITFGSSSGSDEMEELAKKLRGVLLNFIYLPIWKVAWKDHDKLALSQRWQESIDLARRQIRQPNWKLHAGSAIGVSSAPEDFPFPKPSLRQKSLLNRIRCPFSSRFTDTDIRALNRSLDSEATRELAVTAIALKRFQIAGGSHPAALDELVPKFLAKTPIDPFDGQPLRYRRNADGTFLLYSVGSDGQDNGGEATPRVTSNKPQFLNGRDIVWPRATSAEELEKVIEEDSRSRR